MTRVKVSATLAPELIAEARAVVSTASLSELLDRALEALIERELERRWLEAHDGAADDLPGPVPVDLSHIPWDEPWPRTAATSGGLTFPVTNAGPW